MPDSLPYLEAQRSELFRQLISAGDLPTAMDWPRMLPERAIQTTPGSSRLPQYAGSRPKTRLLVSQTQRLNMSALISTVAPSGED